MVGGRSPVIGFNDKGSGVMGQIRATRPSPAMITAVLALVAALGGTALAGVATTAKLDKKEKKQAKKVATKQINKLAPGLSVASADTATTANSAETANSANTAAQAQNAGTANGVKPVKISFARPTNTPETTFVDRGGVRIRGECDGSQAILWARSTANNGLAKFDIVNADGSSGSSPNNPDFDTGDALQAATVGGTGGVRTVTVTFRGAGGTALSGDVVIAQNAGAAQCVFAGTVLVG
jgi:hypothetical protein